MSRRRPILLIALLGVAAGIVFLLRDPQPQHRPLAPPRNAAALDGADRSPRAPQAAEEMLPPAPVREEAAGAPQGEIVGRVISTDTREGIAGAELTWSSARGAHSARTGERGIFTFRPPEAGAYQLASARADGFIPFGPEWGKSPVAVTFRAGERVRGVTVELTAVHDLLGRVVDAKGAAVPQASVRVLVPRKDEIALFPMRDRFTSDARGEFTFRAELYAVVEAFHATLGSGRERVEPGAKELVIVLEPLPPDAGARVWLEGRVVLGGAGVPGALVKLSSSLSVFPRAFGSLEGYRELTDDEGRFEVSELPPGTYDVSAHLLGTAPAHRFDVTVPAKEPLLLELGTGTRLSGRVTDEGGAAVPAFELSLEWRKAPLERLTIVEAGFVDPQGRWTIEGIAPGDYELEARAQGFVPTLARVAVKEKETTADLVLRRGVLAGGTVRTEGSRAPIGGAKVALEGSDVATIAAADGTFALDGLSPDGFSLQVSAAGHNTRVVGVAPPLRPLELELTPVAPDAGVKTELAGIGLVLRGRGDALVVGQVMPAGGAAAAGLLPGDELTSVDGHVIAELGFEPAIRSIRGPVGTSVELMVRKQGKAPPVAVSATRKKITN